MPSSVIGGTFIGLFTIWRIKSVIKVANFYLKKLRKIRAIEANGQEEKHTTNNFQHSS